MWFYQVIQKDLIISLKTQPNWSAALGK